MPPGARTKKPATKKTPMSSTQRTTRSAIQGAVKQQNHLVDETIATSDVAAGDRGVPIQEALPEDDKDEYGLKDPADTIPTKGHSELDSCIFKWLTSSFTPDHRIEDNDPDSGFNSVPSGPESESPANTSQPSSKKRSVRIYVPSPPIATPNTTKKRRGRPPKEASPDPDPADDIDTSDLVRPAELPCFVQAEGGMKRFGLAWHADFQDLKYRISSLIRVSEWTLSLVYSNVTMKRSERFFVTDNKEFKAMMDEAAEYYNKQIDAIRAERVKKAITSQNARKRKRVHAPQSSKSITDLNLTFYNTSVAPEGKTGVKETAKESKATEGKPESQMARRIRMRGEIVEKHMCKDSCEGVCVIVPSAKGMAEHKKLQPDHIDLWADAASRSLCTTDNPPPSLVLSLTDKPPHTRDGKQAEPPRDTQPAAHPNNANAPTQPLFNHYPPQPLPGTAYPPHAFPSHYPPPYSYPPLFYSGHFGPAPTYPAPYHPAYPPPPAFPQNPYPNTSPTPSTPWLTDWLPSLDLGERGRFGDRFGDLVSGFAVAHIFRLSELAGYAEHDLQKLTFYTKTGSDFHLPLPTASRLVQYVKADIPFLDPIPNRVATPHY
ncbi:hypothetical protein FRC12_004024 [Ceratobasidium sp. 428]|nr:hypothetical protein FRC12_004024 [Ceratobasidium sp. 428]